MDDIVRQAMAKWPNVPHCFGWLMLDARGNWRMRDERAQHLGLPGDKINHQTLLGFINRNYMHDTDGRWYFQNGPQRVYVDLEITPYVVRTDPTAGFLLHTGMALSTPSQAWLTQEGRLLLEAGKVIAVLDDRDAAGVLATLVLNGATASDEQIMAWFEGEHRGALSLPHAGQPLVLQWTSAENLAKQFDFVAQPRAAPTT
ncbi:Protein of unknown function (DUF2946) [Herbaspirillum sp. CF444]|uniref:DUF2946 family protein n=1 Tax=Herbaspirillum sp. CF444 TaxID=1144319 RepID=UPI00027233A1|nr:DUF2946 family protein [Herbaspirillum sp. CF444]EJL90766.1 Protein of unknown function (DUF2946) [Herbaspirillum sp. CF444]